MQVSDFARVPRMHILGDMVHDIGLSLKSVLLWDVALLLLAPDKFGKSHDEGKCRHTTITTQLWT